MDKYDVAVIGGGAAGMIAAIFAASRGKKTAIIEKNNILGRKLLITGKGRCNLTNDCDNNELIHNIPVNGKFLYSAFSDFGSAETMAFFENLGVKLKVERGRRVFPESDKSSDIVNALKKEILRQKTDIIKATVTEISNDLTVSTDIGNIKADSVIVATGGKSYPLTGSTGDGYIFAKKLGHTVTPLRPALVPVITKEKWTASCAGLSLKNVGLKCVCEGRTVFDERGEMLFTHTGISGPMVLTLSSVINPEKLNGTVITIDLKPALDEKKLDARLLRDFSEEPNKEIKNVIKHLLPESIIPTVLSVAGIDEAKKINEITVSERKRIIETVKGLRLTPSALGGYDEAVITCGGISVKEIDPKTMMSKIVPNLFFAGEIIDVNAFTGGYNLQIAFSTGRTAGLNA